MGRKAYDLSWNTTSFPAKLRLIYESHKEQRSNIRSGNSMQRVSGYSALSSTYYSVLGTAAAHFKAILKPSPLVLLAPLRILLWCLTWLPLAVWCYWRMIVFSDRVVKMIGYDGMSANECDIRQSILRRCGRFAEAAECIKDGLRKDPENATRGLLLIAQAEIHERCGEPVLALSRVMDAANIAGMIEKTDPRQAIRIFRRVGNIVGRLNPTGQENVFHHKTRELVEKTPAKDQGLKF